MGKVLNDLLDLLQLEKLEKNLFRGKSQDLGFGAIFGGQVIGQAISAAKETVEPTHFVHSCHSYFLRKGDPKFPVVYDVKRLRDGNSLSVRRIKGIQNGVAIFHMTASFKVREKGFEHQDTMPNAPEPESLMSEQDIALINSDKFSEEILKNYIAEKPIELRPVSVVDVVDPKVEPAKRLVWLKANGKVPSDCRIHHYLLAYASDFNLLSTALQPHGVSVLTPRIQVVPVDHSMWFHHDFKLDEWLLYSIESSSASDGRGLVSGKIFTREGKLVASTIQEGLIRQR